jgi:hypothetical protein
MGKTLSYICKSNNDHVSVFSQVIGALSLLALCFSIPQHVLARECIDGQRAVQEIEPTTSFWNDSSGRRYFEIHECSIKVGTAVLRHYAFEELPRDLGGEYIQVNSFNVYISRPVGELAESAVFFQIESLFKKSTHGFLTNRYLATSSPDNKLGAIMYFEDIDGTGWLIDADYGSAINVNDLSQVGQIVEDLIELTSIGVKNGKE